MCLGVVRVTSWLSLAGDVFSLANAPDDAPGATAWGAGAQLRIPYSPHSFSIQITSRGVKGAHMAGFEFTIPFTLARYFGHRAKPVAAPDTTGDSTGDSTGVSVGLPVVRIANLSFSTSELRVRAGTRVRWENGDQVIGCKTGAAAKLGHLWSIARTEAVRPVPGKVGTAQVRNSDAGMEPSEFSGSA